MKTYSSPFFQGREYTKWRIIHLCRLIGRLYIDHVVYHYSWYLFLFRYTQTSVRQNISHRSSSKQQFYCNSSVNFLLPRSVRRQNLCLPEGLSPLSFIFWVSVLGQPGKFFLVSTRIDFVTTLFFVPLKNPLITTLGIPSTAITSSLPLKRSLSI